MRITNGILAREARVGYQAQMRALETARKQAATGLRVNRPSDDPVATTGIMHASSGLRALEQYRSNLETAQSRLAIEDSILDQLGGALSRARELAAAQAGDTADAQTRQAAKQEVDRLIDFATDLGNTRFAGRYVFGGQYSDSPPFVGEVHDPTRPPSGDLIVEIGEGQTIATNHSAQEIFLDSDAIDALRALSDALGANDPSAVRTSMTRIDNAFGEVQDLVGELGARMSQSDLAVANLESLEVTLQTYRSDLGDADLAKAVTDLVNRQGALEAAMLANAKILNLALTDYLR